MSGEIPRLDLAPKRMRPLSPWNPLDYLTLLYWAFFFPQALRWYVEHFGRVKHRRARGGPALLRALREDPVQRRLVLMACLTALAVPVAASLGLEVVGFMPRVLGVTVTRLLSI